MKILFDIKQFIKIWLIVFFAGFIFLAYLSHNAISVIGAIIIYLIIVTILSFVLWLAEKMKYRSKNLKTKKIKKNK